MLMSCWCVSVYESYWYSDAERWQNPCVMLHVATGKWESTSCHAKYPYVCNQVPPESKSHALL
jgi:hypothetical protein